MPTGTSVETARWVLLHPACRPRETGHHDGKSRCPSPESHPTRRCGDRDVERAVQWHDLGFPKVLRGTESSRRSRASEGGPPSLLDGLGNAGSCRSPREAGRTSEPLLPGSSVKDADRISAPDAVQRCSAKILARIHEDGQLERVGTAGNLMIEAASDAPATESSRLRARRIDDELL
jgi:hypothetical protein